MRAKLTDLILDFELYPRNDVSSQHITNLLDALNMGDPIPPLVVDKKTKRIIDGFHRYNAYKKHGDKTIPVVWRNYKNDADMFADAVRLNNQHGRPFDPYDRKRAVMRLKEYGMSVEVISEIVRIPTGRIPELTEDFVKTRGGATVVLKQGLSRNLRGSTLTPAQVKANEKWSGYNPTYHANQLISILDAGIIPQQDTFSLAMDRLVVLWGQVRKSKTA